MQLSNNCVKKGAGAMNEQEQPVGPGSATPSDQTPLPDATASRDPASPHDAAPIPDGNRGSSEHEAWKRVQDERSCAMLCHVAVLAAMVVPFGHIIGPLVAWLAKREQYPLVDDQGKEALNFQISMTIYTVLILVVFVVGLIEIISGQVEDTVPLTLLLSGAALVLLGIINVVLIVIASVRSYRGERYRYPLSIRFVS
jgi:uncharacterized protein